MKDPTEFWSWFRHSERRLRDIEVPEKEALLDDLLEHLHAFSERLWFEVGGPEHARELIISAEGRLEAFHEVRRLVGAAPEMPGWTIIAFKPAQGFAFVTEYAGLRFSPEATWFLPLASKSEPDAFGLRVAYAHYDKALDNEFVAGTFLMLDAGLGELAAAERIRHLEVGLLPSQPEQAGYIVLTELPDYLAFLDRRAMRDP